MKIAFLNVTQSIVDRGAETFVHEVSQRLKKKHKVTVLSGKKMPPKRWPFLWRLFIDPHGLAILKFTFESLPTIWREKFDVVVPLNGGWQPALVRIITWLYGGRMVISGQSGMGWDDIVNLWGFPDVFIGISTFAKKWAKKINPLLRVEYVPNGVDLKKFAPDGEKINLKLRKPVILYVGALEPGKRVLETIKAVAKLKDTSLLVVGSGGLKDKAEKLGKELLGDKFLLTKFSYEELPAVYRAADVFTIGSKAHYSFEIVLVEAMASGLAVVTNNDPIRREIVGDAGLFVNPENTEEYSKTLERVLKTKWGDKPRKQAEKFSWDKIADQHNNLFKEVVK